MKAPGGIWAEPGLACESIFGGVVAEDIEKFDLVRLRWFEEIGAFDHREPTGSAARAPARKRDSGARLVAHVDEATPPGRAYRAGRFAGTLEDDD